MIRLRLNKISVLAFLLLTSTLLSIFCTVKKQNSPEIIKDSFAEEIKRLQNLLEKEMIPAIGKKEEKAIKAAFLTSRMQYKKVEYYVEYFFPSTSGLLNGAPIDEIELGENMIETPTGFQVMEELIYDTPTKDNRETLLNEVRKMQLNLKRTLSYNEKYELTDAQIFDAIRLEIFRITSLGITGFDTPLSGQGLPESAAALNGIQMALSNYENTALLNKEIKAAVSYLDNHKIFNSFDRLYFITGHLQPIGKNLDLLRRKLKLETIASASALNDDAISLFQKDAFNMNKFVDNRTAYLTKEKVALGKLLFNSTILSNSANRSCASCHHSNKAFSDGLVTAKSINGDKSLLRNTPGLTYSGLQRAFFYDMKAGNLEDQAMDVVHHKEEMNGSLEEASKRINKRKMYIQDFEKAFPNQKTDASPWKIQNALAAYIRSLSPFSSRFDKYVQGDKTSLNETEKTGFNLFMGKAKCGTCHFAPVFNGTRSPLFDRTEAEILGLPAKPDTINATIDPDLGRYALNSYPQYKYAFKTTGLRNIAKTAPYMHNGAYKTLEQVLDFYNRGGGAGIGIHLENQTLSTDPLQLTPQEIKAVIAFLKSLDDQ